MLFQFLQLQPFQFRRQILERKTLSVLAGTPNIDGYEAAIPDETETQSTQIKSRYGVSEARLVEGLLDQFRRCPFRQASEGFLN